MGMQETGNNTQNSMEKLKEDMKAMQETGNNTQNSLEKIKEDMKGMQKTMESNENSTTDLLNQFSSDLSTVKGTMSKLEQLLLKIYKSTLVKGILVTGGYGGVGTSVEV